MQYYMWCTADFMSLFPYENGSKGYERAEKCLNKFSQEVTGTMQTMASVLRRQIGISIPYRAFKSTGNTPPTECRTVTARSAP